MDNIVFTVINACFTLASVVCAVVSVRQTRQQTKIMQEQLDESKKPRFQITLRLESIANELHRISERIKNSE